MVLIFLDDGVGCNKSYNSALQMGADIKADLLAPGFVPNAYKSVWQPVQTLIF